MLQIFSDSLFSGPLFCQRWIPDSPHAHLYAALVCGINVQQQRDLWVETGLIHLLVVSGAHLHFLERLWRPWPGCGVVLVLYGWLTGFGPPVVRALARRAMGHATHARGASPLQIEWLTSVSLLIAYPLWWSSRSFLMSWMCSLALAAGDFIAKPWRTVARGILCYALLFPFTAQNPLTLLWNWLLAPWMSAVLFPTSIAAFVAPVVVPIVDGIWTLTLMVLFIGPRAPAFGTGAPTPWLWTLPLLLNSLLIYGEIKWRRALAFSQ